jgi:hypothetical protein
MKRYVLLFEYFFQPFKSILKERIYSDLVLVFVPYEFIDNDNQN